MTDHAAPRGAHAQRLCRSAASRLGLAGCIGLLDGILHGEGPGRAKSMATAANKSVETPVQLVLVAPISYALESKLFVLAPRGGMCWRS